MTKPKRYYSARSGHRILLVKGTIALMCVILVFVQFYPIEHRTSFSLFMIFGIALWSLGLSTYYNLYYVILGKKIVARIYFIDIISIDIRKISKIRKGGDLHIYGNSYRDSIRLESIDGEKVHISPRDREAFFKRLLEVNPAINIQV